MQKESDVNINLENSQPSTSSCIVNEDSQLRFVIPSENTNPKKISFPSST